MYIPNDIWQIIKTFMFKTPEMKQYDIFIENFNEKISAINNIHFPNEPYEQMMYNSWSFAERYMFIYNYSIYL
tara:strand:- start:172 stop:390 length:219 start_codon:yes stop_codon:yes gene_type:complete